MSPAKQSATSRLGSLEASVGTAKHHERMALDRVEAGERELDELASTIANAYAAGDDVAARETRELATRAEADLVEARDRLEGAKRAVQAADNAATVFARDNNGDLVRERDRTHSQLQAEADRIVAQLVAIGARAREEEGVTSRIFRRAGRSDRVRELDAETRDLIRQARRTRRVDAAAPAVKVPA